VPRINSCIQRGRNHLLPDPHVRTRYDHLFRILEVQATAVPEIMRWKVENWALLEYYEAYSDVPLPTFRSNLSVQSDGPDGLY